ncbi:MAG: glycosyltransferase family 9 protein [Verrucomicrobiota bacterium]|nr:glycosyltransferase family 9 protein [Verrucomicrobiota bacterium]
MLKQSLLIFELRMMGDAVMSLPFVRAAKQKYTVFVCCQPSVADVFRTLLPDEQLVLWRPPWLDEEKKYSLSKWKHAEIKPVLQRLRAVRAQIAITVWADARIHLLMALSGAIERIGFPMNARNVYASQLTWRRRQILIGRGLNLIGSLGLGRKLLTQKFFRADYFQHHVRDWRQLAETLDLNWNVEFPWFSAPQVSLPKRLSIWLEDARRSGQKIWLLHPGARTPNRRWPLEQFRALIEQTFLPGGMPLIVIDPMESRLAPGRLPGVFTYCPASLAEFFGIVNAVDCVVCNDTGVGHVAAALGKRVVSIFSANRPEWFAPYGNLDLTAAKDVCPHRPCLNHCVMPSYICLEAVTVEMVKRQIEKLNSPCAQIDAPLLS